MEFLYSITMYKCGVYNIPEKLQMITTFFTYYGTNLVFPVKMDKKFNQIYYSDDGYWRGRSAIQKLSKATGSTKEEAERWLLKQPLYQIYLPAPKYIPRPNASLSLYAKPNDIHQADILYLPHDKFK